MSKNSTEIKFTKKNKELLFKNDKQMTKSAEQNKKESQQFHTSIVMNQ